jgi:hypothetical protein
MLNIKQKELSENLYNTLKGQFPDIELVEIIECPFEEGDVWMRVIPPTDSEQESQFSHLAAEMVTDILLDYGHDILITYASYPPTATH